MYKIYNIIIKLFLTVIVFNFFNSKIKANETANTSFNTFELESIDHWNVKISRVNWESATVKNALEVPYTTFISDYIKSKFNLIINDLPKKIKGVGYQFSMPKCKDQKCSDLYIYLITSKSNNFLSTKQFQESSITTFKTSTDTINTTLLSNGEGYLSSSKQDLKNLFIGYHNDYFLFQNHYYLKNLGFRFGAGVDIYQYKAKINGVENLISFFDEKHQNDPSQNKTSVNFSNIILKNDLNYIEFALKIKTGVHYLYEFLQRNIIFLGIDIHYGYGAVSYKLKELRINPDFLSLLNSSTLNPLTLFNALPQSRSTDGPAFLEIPGYEYYLSYGYKIDTKQIVRIIYKYKQEYHNLRSPKIEPDENINLSALSQGDLTPIILSELKPSGLLPNNSEFMREIAIEYMYRF